MSPIEVIVLVLALVGAFVAYQSHKNHLTFKAQADDDLATLKADVATLKTKLAVHEAVSAPVMASAPVVPPVAPAA